MSIKIDIPSYLQPFTNNMEAVEANGSTVDECLNHLVKQFPGMEKMLLAKNGKLLNYVNIYINGEDAYPDELAKPVKDGDELYILYIIGGG
ncbi:MoaD/ThiS family protein [Chloroflexota bacterium]